MTASYRSSTITGLGNASSLIVTAPADVVAGDLLLAFIATSTDQQPITPPNGWTQASLSGNAFSTLFYKYAGTGDAGTQFTFTPSAPTDMVGAIAAYIDVPSGMPIQVTHVDSGGTSVTTSSVTTTHANEPVLEWAVRHDTGQTGGSIGAPATVRVSWDQSYVSGYLCEQTQVSAGATPRETFTATPNQSALEVLTVALSSNTAPNKPTVEVAQTIDSGATNRISAPFSDPDLGDSCSQTDFQWWDLSSGARVGGPYTKTVSGATPTYWDAPGGTFSNGDKEIQAQSYDQSPTPSGWGPSAFFTAATPTGVPTITDPINGGTIGSSTYTVKWSTAGGQVAYQVRRVADNAGAADATTVYWDSGQVTDSGRRSLLVPFETNNRWEHVQVRVTADGTLWSSWADARVDVSYTPPAGVTATMTPDPASGTLLFTITNPVPAAGQPDASYNEVHVDDGKGEGYERVGSYLAPNQPFRYALPVGSRAYSGNAFIRTYGSNGTYTDTAL